EAQDVAALGPLLRDWEQWASELLESHLSYPVLAYYRSQHDRQSWIAALTAILDTSALAMAGIEGVSPWRAQLTFAIARHAVVGLSVISNASPRDPDPDRLPPEELGRLRAALAAAGVPLQEGAATDEKLAKLRRLYEPYVYSLSERLLFPLPPWILPAET